MNTFLKAIEHKKVLVFDLNGTITERVSDHPYHLAYRDAYIEKNLGRKLDVNLPKSTSLALQICGLRPVPYYIHRNADIDWTKFHQENKEIRELLILLKKQGKRLVLYTDCLSVQVKKTLEIMKLTNVFDLIITGEFNLKKPDPKAYTFIAARLKTDLSQLVMIGNDLAQDLLPAQIAGASVFQVSNVKEFTQIASEVLLSNLIDLE